MAVSAVLLAGNGAVLWGREAALGISLAFARLRGYDGCACPDCGDAFSFGPVRDTIPCCGRAGDGEVFVVPVSSALVLYVVSLPLAEYARRKEEDGAGECPTCGYDLAGLAGGRCPECGQDAAGQALRG